MPEQEEAPLVPPVHVTAGINILDRRKLTDSLCRSIIGKLSPDDSFRYLGGLGPGLPTGSLVSGSLPFLSSLNVPPGMYQAHMQANQHALLQAQPAPHPQLQG